MRSDIHWDSHLSVGLKFGQEVTNDSTYIVAIALARDTSQEKRDICVNLRFVATFYEYPEDKSIVRSEYELGTHEIAESELKKDGHAFCTERYLEPGGTFTESFTFSYSHVDFSPSRGYVVVMCQIWFQPESDIPHGELEWDIKHFDIARVPEFLPSN